MILAIQKKEKEEKKRKIQDPDSISGRSVSVVLVVKLRNYGPFLTTISD